MIQGYSLPCFFIRINKRLTRVTILNRSVAVLTIHRISKPIETKVFSVVYCYLNTVKIPISVWRKLQKLIKRGSTYLKTLVLFESVGWLLESYLVLLGAV